jgi:hypothetical protein
MLSSLIRSWPAKLAGAGACGIAGSALALTNDRFVKGIVSLADQQLDGETANGMTFRCTTAVVGMLAVCNVPAGELKVRLIDAGCTQFWCRLLSLPLLEQREVSLTGLNALLDGTAALSAFHQNVELYALLTQDVIPQLLLPHSVFGELSLLSGWQRAPELHAALSLGATLASHPQFSMQPSEEQRDMWLGLLQEGADGTALQPSASVHWVSLAAACAEQPSFAHVMLKRSHLTGRLARLVSSKPTPPPSDAAPRPQDAPMLSELEDIFVRRQAQLALHRLTQAAAAGGGPSHAKQWRAGVRRVGAVGDGAGEFVMCDTDAPDAPLERAPVVWQPAPLLPSLGKVLCYAAGGLIWGGLRGRATGAAQVAPSLPRVLQSSGRLTAAATAVLCVAYNAKDAVADAAAHHDGLATGVAEAVQAEAARASLACQEVGLPTSTGAAQRLRRSYVWQPRDTLAAAAAKASGDLIFCGALLGALLQRAPYVAGGWALGFSLSFVTDLVGLTESIDEQAQR